MPTPRSWPAPSAGVVNGLLYVVGGTSVTGTGTALTTLEAYDPVSNTWTTKASMSIGREGPAAGVINGVLYVAGGVVGGTNGGTALTALEAYDPVSNTWTTKAPMPTARGGAAAGVINGVLYVVGGITGGGTTLTSVEAYNPGSNTWAMKAPVPTPGFGMASDVINEILYVAGGATAAGTGLTSVEAYDPATDTWTPKASMPQARGGAAAGVINGVLYLTGGSFDALTSVEAYNPVTNTWATKNDTDIVSVTRYNSNGTVHETIDNYVDGNFTTSFIRQDCHFKDNRILPNGWRKYGPDIKQFNGKALEETWPELTGDDPSYADPLGALGRSIVRYRVTVPSTVTVITPVPAGIALGVTRVTLGAGFVAACAFTWNDSTALGPPPGGGFDTDT